MSQLRWKAVSQVDHIAEGLLIYEGALLAGRRLGVQVAEGFPLVSEVVWQLRGRRFGWVVPAGIVVWLAIHFATGGHS